MGGKLPSGQQTDDLNIYTSEWKAFNNKIEMVLNSNCSIVDLLEIPFSPKEIRVASKSSNDNKRFNLPIWAAKKLINKKEYVMEEHKINNLISKVLELKNKVSLTILDKECLQRESPSL